MQRVGVRRRWLLQKCADAQQQQTYLCVLDAYVSILPAFIPVSPANLSVSARVKKRPTRLCVGCRHLSVNSLRFPSLFLCLSLCQT